MDDPNDVITLSDILEAYRELQVEFPGRHRDIRVTSVTRDVAISETTPAAEATPMGEQALKDPGATAPASVPSPVQATPYYSNMRGIYVDADTPAFVIDEEEPALKSPGLTPEQMLQIEIVKARREREQAMREERATNFGKK